MAEIVNLRLVRKAKQRADKAGTAAANRAKFGQSKAEKALRQNEALRSERELNGAKLERD